MLVTKFNTIQQLHTHLHSVVHLRGTTSILQLLWQILNNFNTLFHCCIHR